MQAENLTPEQKERLDECVENVGRMILATMQVFEIPNYINATYQVGDEFYRLRFEKMNKPVKLT